MKAAKPDRLTAQQCVIRRRDYILIPRQSKELVGKPRSSLLGWLNSFHEKAGMSQMCFSLSFLWIPYIRARPPLSPPFHPHSW
jgi:hypothetical protein